jgi:hypothetical protein
VRYITVALILTLDFHIISYTCRHSLSLVTSWATNMVMIALGAFMVLGCFERYLNDVWPGYSSMTLTNILQDPQSMSV